jgi:hypothetical protein
VLGDLVGAIDVDRQRAGVVELGERDAVRLEALGGLHRRRDRALDAALELRELVDEEVGRRAGADADPRVVDDVRDRVARDRLLELVLGHAGAPRKEPRILRAR